MTYITTPPGQPHQSLSEKLAQQFLLVGSQKAFIVSYDLKSPALHYIPLMGVLQESENWWHFLQSTWIVIRTESLSEFAEKLRSKIDQNDRLLVIPARKPADGWLPAEAWNWIDANLRP